MRTLHFLVLVPVLGLMVQSVSHAGEVPPADAVVAGRAGSTAPAGVGGDPNLDRGFVLPTAMTQPAGSLTYNNYEVLFHGVTYGVTDRIQTSLTALSPITSDMPLFALGSVKARLLSVGAFHLAVQGSVAYMRFFDSQNNGDSGDWNSRSDDSAYMLSAGAFSTACLREDCSSILTLSATYSVGLSNRSSSNAQTLVYGGSIVHSVTPYLKLLGEVVSGSLKTSSGDLESAPGALVGYGVRLHSNRLAADIGFMKPVSSDGGLDGFLLGLPFVSLSYRWL